MRVLIIEDESKTALYLKKGLIENGFNVDIAANGLDGVFAATNYQYQLIILDIMLPQLNGWNVVNQLRQQENFTPILILTARDAVQDRVKGLELGADDYLVKPFAFSELLARVRSLLRRSSNLGQLDILRIANLEINLLTHKAVRGDKKLHLTAKEFALLTLFARRKGELLSRTLIAEQIWDMNFDSDTNVVDVAVRRLRQKIDDPFEKN